MTESTLDIRDLRVSFRDHVGSTEVLHGISLRIAAEERVALVGESGSGKSVTARAVLGLLDGQRNASVSGTIKFAGRDLAGLGAEQVRRLRGTQISTIFQDPVSSLNPVYRIATQFREVVRRVDPGVRTREMRAKAEQILRSVSIAEPRRVMESFPFQLSGGMNQRVMIAMALVNEPSLLIADEPGTALDVTVQDQSLRLMRRLVEERRTAVFFISHNLGIVREFADRLYVIYRGRIVEEGPTDAVFANPRHPYTRALLAAVPRITSRMIPEIDDDPEAFLAPREVHEPGRTAV